MTPRNILAGLAIALSVISFFAPIPQQVPTILLGVAMLLP